MSKSMQIGRVIIQHYLNIVKNTVLVMSHILIGDDGGSFHYNDNLGKWLHRQRTAKKKADTESNKGGYSVD